MHDQSLGAFDKLILVVSFIGAGVFGYALYRSDMVVRYFVQQQQGEKSIGRIVTAQNDVRRKMNQSLTWYKANNKEEVFERDTFFTGGNSGAVIRLNDSTKLKLDANSLVVIQTKSNEIVFDLQAGSMNAESSGAKPIKVAYAGKITEIKAKDGNTEVQIAKNDEGLKFATQAGAIEVNVEGQKALSVDTDEVLKIDNSFEIKKHTLPVHLTSYKDGEQVWLAPNADLKFKWQSDEPQRNYQLQIARDAEFHKLLYNQKITGYAKNWRPANEDSIYFWRVTDVRTGASLSKTQSVQRLLKSAVVLKFPTHDIRVYENELMYDNETRSVNLSWIEKVGQRGYVVQVADDSNFSKLIFEEKSNSTEVTHEFKRGDYFWRVRTEGAPTDGLWSQIAKFSVGSKEKPAPRLIEAPSAPSSTSPEITQEDILDVPVKEKLFKSPVINNQEQKITLRFTNDFDVRSPASVEKAILNPPEFSWSKVEGARGYALEIDRDGDFLSPIKVNALADNHYVWTAVKPGHYYWRVKSRYSGSESSEYSPVGEISIYLPAPKLARKFVETDNLNSNDRELYWGQVPLASGYLIQVGNKSEIQKNENFIYKISENKTYNIRVAAVDSADRQVSSFTTYHVSHDEWLEKLMPRLVSPISNITAITFNKAKPNVMMFVWSEVKGAQGYEIQFSQDQDFKTVLVSEKLATNQYIFKNEMKASQVYWRVRTQFEKHFSRWTNARSYQIQ